MSGGAELMQDLECKIYNQVYTPFPTNEMGNSFSSIWPLASSLLT